MPPRFIPIGGQEGSGGGFQGGGRFQPLQGGKAQIPQFFSAPSRRGASRFVPVSGGREGPPPLKPPPQNPLALPTAASGLLGLGASLGNLGGLVPSPVVTGVQGGTALLGLGRGLMDLSQGQTRQGGLEVGAGLAGGLQAGANARLLPEAAGTVGGLLGGAVGLASDITSKKSDTEKALDAAVDVAATAGNLVLPGVSLAAPLVKADITRTLGDIQSGDISKLLLMDLNPAMLPINIGKDIVAAGNPLDAIGPMLDALSGRDAGISKDLMRAKQTAFQQGATASVDTALTNAQSYPQILQVLSQIPPGTGQLQYGVGQNYTGETTVGGPSLTQTPGWQQTLSQAQQDPASFIKNFWVKTGQSGATGFDAGLTRSWQTKMIQALPEGPLKTSLMDWAAGMVPTDPGGSDFTAANQAYQAWVTGGRQGLSPYQRIQTQSLYNTLVPQAQDLLTYSGYRGNPEAAQAALNQINPLALQLGYAPFSLPLPPDFPPADTSAFSGG